MFPQRSACPHSIDLGQNKSMGKEREDNDLNVRSIDPHAVEQHSPNIKATANNNNNNNNNKLKYPIS